MKANQNFIKLQDELAGMSGFKEAAFFEAPKDDKAVPKVKF